MFIFLKQTSLNGQETDGAASYKVQQQCFFTILSFFSNRTCVLYKSLPMH